MVDTPAPRLVELPVALGTTRDALHQLAFLALAPRRYASAGRLGLVALPGGIGTPRYDGGSGSERVRMRGDQLVVEADGESRQTRPGSVREASYGASPGDDDHDEPYPYVAPWGDHPDDPWWNDPTFGGASLSHSDLLASDDPFATAVAFLRRGHDLLTR